MTRDGLPPQEPEINIPNSEYKENGTTTIKNISLDEEELKKLMEVSGKLSADNIVVPEVYKELFLDNYRYYILSSGRVSGKTSILVTLWWGRINAFPDRDIIILQATKAEIKDSLLNEIRKFLTNSGFDVGDSPTNEWYIPKSNDKIIKKGQKGGTYFFPITDSKGGQRTRGINTRNQISLVLYEECQKNKDSVVVEQSVITFIRQLDKKAKLVIVGNNETVGHWFVDYVEEKRRDPEWCYVYANCFHIWKLLNDQTRAYILKYKELNYLEFRRLFLGDIKAVASDVVFPQFTREKNYKKAEELSPNKIRFLIVGIDHATANDTFAIVPVAILADGTTQTLQVCYDDPEETQRTLAPTEQCDILENFMDFLNDYYGFQYNQTPIYLSIDGASAPFIAQVKHKRKTARNRIWWNTIKIKGFTKKNKDVNLGIIKNAFAYGVLTILNEGVYDWKGKKNSHRLAHEIEAQRYKNGKLDPKIKNDLCDALEYGLIPYYSNCYNISFPIRKQRDNEINHYEDIRNLAYGKRGGI